ncbi:MAG: Lrp/AsnC family transcriptional regulator [Pseudomonadota bacterium]
MDDIDRKILAVLQGDATIALDSLGEKVGLSRNACWRRVKALESDGVIASRVTLLSPEKIGVGLTVFVKIRAAQLDGDWQEGFERAVADTPEILGAYRMSGDFDYLLRAQVPDLAGYDALRQRLISQLALTEISASFVLEEVKHTTALPL